MRRNRPCPLCPRKRTCAVQLGMSALCQKRTFAPQQLMFDLESGLKSSTHAINTTRQPQIAFLPSSENKMICTLKSNIIATGNSAFAVEIKLIDRNKRSRRLVNLKQSISHR